MVTIGRDKLMIEEYQEKERKEEEHLIQIWHQLQKTLDEKARAKLKSLTLKDKETRSKSVKSTKSSKSTKAKETKSPKSKRREKMM